MLTSLLQNIIRHAKDTFLKYLVAHCLFIAVLYGAAEDGCAQQTGVKKSNIKGYVKDAESNESLPFANVMLKGTYTGSSTNVDGYFVIFNVPVGACTLAVSYMGYAPKEFALNNSADKDSLLIIKLTESPITVSEVVITGKVDMVAIASVPSKVTISPKQLLTLPNFGEVDLFRSLQLLPGISGVNDGSSGLYVRGGTPDQNLVLLDGMKIYHVDHFFGFFSAFNADAVKDVQMYKSVFPAEYGGRISSVVDLTGKTGSSNNVRIGAGATLLNGNAVIEVPLSETMNWLVSGRRSYTDFLKTPLYNSIYGFLTGDKETAVQPGAVRRGRGRMGNIDTGTITPDFYFYDLNSKITWRPTRKDIFSASFYSGKDNLDQSQDFGGASFRFRGFSDQGAMTQSNITEWGNTGMSGKWSRHWSDRIYSHFLLAHSTYFSDYDRNRSVGGSTGLASRFSNASEEKNRVEDSTIRIDNELSLTNAHSIKIGMELSQLNTSYNATLNDTTRLLSRESSAIQNSLYIQDTWKLSHYFDLTTGVRGTYYDQTGVNYVEPRASFNLRLTDYFGIKGGWGQYNQFVNRITNENVLEGSRDFWMLSDNDLKPGYAEHRVLGFSFENDTYLVDIEGYQKKLENLLEYTRRFNIGPFGRNIGGISQRNTNFFAGTGEAKGLDVLLQKKRGSFTGWLAYTLGKVEYEFPGINGGNPFPADHDRTHEFKFVGTLSKGPWDFSATWVLASGKAYTSPESQYYLTLLDGSTVSYIHVSDKNSQRLPSYQRLDISVSRHYQFDTWFLDAGMSVFNTYNHKNVYYREYNLDTTPIVVTDMMMLGFTPSLYCRIQIR